MMVQAELLEAVTQAVLQRLQRTENDLQRLQGVAIGGSWPGWQDFEAQLRPQEVAQALIVRLQPWEMVNLSQGQAFSVAEQFILNMLLLGKKVYLAADGLIYQQYRHSAPKVLFNRYIAAEETLKQMGIRYLAEPMAGTKAALHLERKVITEQMVQSFISQNLSSVVLAPKTIVTPLAADMLRAARIDVIRGT